MKALNDLLVESVLNIGEETINYIPVKELEEYLKIANKYLSPDAKIVIQYLIDNNSTYVKDFGTSENGNSLASFYCAGVPNDENLKTLYKALGNLNRKRRLNEVPVFQTEDEFNGILNKTLAVDYVLLDFETEAGKEHIAELYMPLVHKICKQWKNKSAVSYEDLFSAGLEGLAEAINDYQNPKAKNVDSESIVNTSFTQYASYRILHKMTEVMDYESRTVRRPKTDIKKEKETTGKITTNNTVSGEEIIGHDKDGNGKTRFDTLDNKENSGKNIIDGDIETLWKEIHDILRKKFSERDLNIFYSVTAINGRTKVDATFKNLWPEKWENIEKRIKEKDTTVLYEYGLQSKEVADIYGIGQSTVTAIVNKIKIFMASELESQVNDLRELYTESIQNKYQEEFDIYTIKYEDMSD